METIVKPVALSVKRQRTKVFSIANVAIYLILILWAVGTVFPFLWVFNASFKNTTQILNNSFAISFQPIMDNYTNAFSKLNILRSYMNSIIISGSTMLLVIFFATLAAFAMTRYTFKGKKLLHSIVIGSLMFPAYSTIIPVFKMVFHLGQVGKPLGVILPQVAGNMSFAMIVMMGFLGSLPLDLEEAAFIDGCNVFQIFFKIVVPLAKSSLATVAIFTFLWSYNDLFLQLIIMRSPKDYPICALLNEISSKYGTDYGLMAASVVLIVAPVLVVYMILQKNIIKGLTVGAIKG